MDQNNENKKDELEIDIGKIIYKMRDKFILIAVSKVRCPNMGICSFSQVSRLRAPSLTNSFPASSNFTRYFSIFAAKPSSESIPPWGAKTVV